MLQELPARSSRPVIHKGATFSVDDSSTRRHPSISKLLQSSKLASDLLIPLCSIGSIISGEEFKSTLCTHEKL